MSAFINGAESAFKKVIKLIDILDKEEKDENLQLLKQNVTACILLYKEFDKLRYEKPVIDTAGFKIEEVSKSVELDEEDVEEILKA